MSGAFVWGWDNTNSEWVRLQCDASGHIMVTPDPVDGHLFGYDDSAGAWKKLQVDSDLRLQVDAANLMPIGVIPEGATLIRDYQQQADGQSTVYTVAAGKEVYLMHLLVVGESHTSTEEDINCYIYDSAGDILQKFFIGRFYNEDFVNVPIMYAYPFKMNAGDYIDLYTSSISVTIGISIYAYEVNA